MKFVIKKFDDLSLNDFYEIVRIRFDVFVMEQKITCEYDIDEIDKISHHVMAINDNGEMVSYCRIINEGIVYDESSIGRVVTLKKHRNKGIGYNVIKKALDFIKENLKYKNVKLSSQEHAIGFYEKLGFKVCSEVYLDANIPHVKMIKEF